MNLFLIIWTVVVTAVMFAVLLWAFVELFRLNKQLKNDYHDLKIMNKNNVDEFIKSPEWHEHLQNCSGKKHSKCVTINKE